MEARNGRYDFTLGTYWYKDNVLHREGGPAVEYKNGGWTWYHRGKVHRLDGPAVHYTAEEVARSKTVLRLASNTHYVNECVVPDAELHLFDSEEGRLQLVLKYGMPT